MTQEANPSISIVLADDHPVALHGVTGILGAQPDMEVLAACNDGRSAADAIRQFAPDIAVLDFRLSGLDGLEVLAAIAGEGDNTKVVFFTAAATDDQILAALAKGVKGILLKDAAPDRLVDCVREVAAGKQWFPADLVDRALRRVVDRRAESGRFVDKLTAREREIILLVAEGLSNKGIARRTNLTEGTIKLHLHNIYEKLGITNRTALTALAMRLGRPNNLGVLILLALADLVERLAGQHAHAAAPGRVEIQNSIAAVQHAKGVVENLKAGDALLKGDVVMTGDASALPLRLTGGTALNTGASAALKISSGTFELNAGSLQPSLISIALASAFLVDRTAALATPIANDEQSILENNAVADITGALSGLGSFTINAGATLQFGTGLHTISGATTDNGKNEVTKGALDIGGRTSATGSLQIDSGATLHQDSAHSLNVALPGSTGELILKHPGHFTGTISGLTGSDQIDLVNINWQTAKVSSASYSATTNVTTLVITDGQHADSILLVGDYRSSTWMFSNDGSGGTIVVDPLKTAVTLDITESSVVTDTIAARSDAAPSSSITTDDATISASKASGTATVDLASIGFDLSLDHIQFEDSNAESVVPAKVAATESDGLHASSQWLANFFSSTADDQFPTLQPAGAAIEQVAVAHTQLENSHSSNDLSSLVVDLPAQPALHNPSIVPAANPADHTTLTSLPTPALNAPPFDDGALPAAHLLVTEADPPFAGLGGEAGAHAVPKIPAADPDDHPTLSSMSTAAFNASALEQHAPTVDSSEASLAPQLGGLSSELAEHELSTMPAEPLAVAGLTLPDQLASSPTHPGPVHATPHLMQLPGQPSEHLLSASPATDSAPVHANPAPQLIGVASPMEAHPLSGYMVLLFEDQFQFADLNTNQPHPVPHPADLISHSAAPQLLIEATTPADHTAGAHEIATLPGPEFVMLHSHHGVHASIGII